jgi:streptomycin 6-kinase
VVRVDLSSPALEETRRRLLDRFGAGVEAWWQRLPAVVAESAERWQLLVGDAIGRGNTSLVIRCRRADGRAALLKLTPEPVLAAEEAWALRIWAHTGRVPLLWEHDVGAGVLLLEAIPSEAPLSELGLHPGVGEIARLVGGLHGVGAPIAGHRVDSLAERIEFIFDLWVERHRRRGEAATSAVPLERLRRGRELARALSAEAREGILLHGDLHPGNVLHGGCERGLVAIDPRPCVGERAADVVDWVFWGADDPRDWEPRSRELALALGIDHERLWAWCAAFAAMLAASKAARGAGREQTDALLALAP